MSDHSIKPNTYYFYVRNDTFRKESLIETIMNVNKDKNIKFEHFAIGNNEYNYVHKFNQLKYLVNGLDCKKLLNLEYIKKCIQDDNFFVIIGGNPEPNPKPLKINAILTFNTYSPDNPDSGATVNVLCSDIPGQGSLIFKFFEEVMTKFLNKENISNKQINLDAANVKKTLEFYKKHGYDGNELNTNSISVPMSKKLPVKKFSPLNETIFTFNQNRSRPYDINVQEPFDIESQNYPKHDLVDIEAQINESRSHSKRSRSHSKRSRSAGGKTKRRRRYKK